MLIKQNVLKFQLSEIPKIIAGRGLNNQFFFKNDTVATVNVSDNLSSNINIIVQSLTTLDQKR